MQLTVTNRDLRRLVAIADPARLHEPDPLFPPSVLHDLAELVPSDELHYQYHDPYREIFLGFRTEDELSYEPDDEDDDVDAWWANYWILAVQPSRAHRQPQHRVGRGLHSNHASGARLP
jgi:hypothetical protein